MSSTGIARIWPSDDLREIAKTDDLRNESAIRGVSMSMTPNVTDAQGGADRRMAAREPGRKKPLWPVIAGTAAAAAAAAAVLGAAFLGSKASGVAEPRYRLVEKHGNIEVRDYAPTIVAQVQVRGQQYEALGEGFRIIANYIFGNNVSARKVAMTAPVTQQGSQEIAMTAPVTQQGDGHTWQVRFIMPAGYTLETLPKPNNPAVVLEEIGSMRFAVIRFSGWAREGSLKRHTADLNSFLDARNLRTVSAATYAFYDPPWTLPFLRRNEVMVGIVGESPSAQR